MNMDNERKGANSMRIVTDLTKGWGFAGPAETLEEALAMPIRPVV